MSKSNFDNKFLYNKKNSFCEYFLNFVIYFSSIIVFFIFISIIFYVVLNGVKYLSLEFVFGIYSEYLSNKKGLLPMIINTLYILIISLLLAVPIGVGSAVYLTQYSSEHILFNKFVNVVIDIFAGVPSIIYGLFGFTVFCIGTGLGTSILAGCFTMVLCTLPSIIKSTTEAFNCVSKEYIRAAQTLGASKLRIIFTIILPSSMRGIITSVVLASSRIIGESSALIYTSGMGYKMPKKIIGHIFKSGRTLTLHLYQSSKQASEPNSLGISFATATVLLILVFILNLTLELIFKEKNKNL